MSHITYQYDSYWLTQTSTSRHIGSHLASLYAFNEIADENAGKHKGKNLTSKKQGYIGKMH